MGRRSIKILAPAKLNLFLDVSETKRKDGYHSLTTLYERIDLCDELEIRESQSGIHFQCTSPHVPKGKDNLIVRAAEFLKKKCNIKSGVSIRLKKKIPVAAGLGGGSSNAASTLLGLNRLWRLGLSQKALLRLSASLGADVPFFVLESPFALGRGRGERVEPFPFKGIIRHVLAFPRRMPQLRRKTARIYSHFDKKCRQNSFKKALLGPVLTPLGNGARILSRLIQEGHALALRCLLLNKLEHAAFDFFPQAREVKEALLDRGAWVALLSGSGPSIFGIIGREREKDFRTKVSISSFKGWHLCFFNTFRRNL